MTRTLTATSEHAGERLDSFLAAVVLTGLLLIASLRNG